MYKEIPFKNNKKINDWIYFSLGYLQLAAAGCVEMRENDKKDKNSKDYLFAPVIYNIKHSIEIFLKTLLLVLREVEKIKEEIHDAEELFKIFEREIKKIGLKKIVKKINESDEDIINSFKKEFNFNDIENTIKEMKEITIKYQKLVIIKKKINENNFEFNDCFNDFFRYPQNKMKIDIYYTNLLNLIKAEDVEEVMLDIKKLLDSFGVAAMILITFKQLIEIKN